MSLRRWSTGLLALLAMVAVVGLSACSSGDSGDATAAAANGEGEVFLEPAGEVGADPFTPSVANSVPVPPKLEVADSSAGAGSDAGAAVASETGTTDELYGGSGELSVCDKGRLIDFLTENPTERAAWAGVLGISPGDDVEVARYIEGLAPVILRADARVTNHGYADGGATARQSVLQAGTAVLVDGRGIPRVRCACGNPLLEPVAVTSGPTYVGSAWDGFEPARVIVIVPGPPVTELVVINVSGGGVIRVRVRGTTPETTTPASPTVTEAPDVTPTVSEGEPTGDGYTSCARRFGEAVRDLTIAGIPPDPSWPEDAERAAELARSGDLAGAYEICEKTVAEMQEALAAG